MNINTNIYKQYVKSGCSRVPRSYFSGSYEKSPVGKKDSFYLSSEASMFRECGKVIKSSVAEITSPADNEKINSLRQQIKSGNYNISSGQVADAILSGIM